MTQLRVESLHLQLEGKTVLTDIGFQARSGEMLGIVGANGAGKSSLLKSVAGLTACGGDVLLDGTPLANMKDNDRARAIGYLPQKPQIAWPLSVERLITLGRLPHLGKWQRPGKADHAKIDDILRMTALTALRHRPFDRLSGGEQARVMIGRVLAGEPAVLLADEPTAALDLSHQLDAMQLLRDFSHAGGIVIVVLHELRLARHFCDRLLLLHQGSMLASGSPQTVLTADNMRASYGIALIGSAKEAFRLHWRKAGE